ncbi:MAG TPA: hypothetical protein PLU85_07605 [Bacteroidia bacterium]|nr:hypothetical protein [Bacteroidia bacterium]QQR95026.1 MAG: hypothetical protein IPJ93_15035 [Bacteroidota bacterium]MBP8669424.1 hypothetical protein [Bacteroidia bacterium]HOZ82938.1 hypothetical protein [Bacteroidia bacterium]HOZ89525.1 hypothetical protein [Bacteroidia bacterium]
MEQLSNQNFQQRNLIEQTVVQLNKDLIPCGFTVAWSGDTFSAYQDIIMQLEVIIRQLAKSGSSTLNAWLYRVDIPEKTLKKVLNKQDNQQALAQAILERTFIKIMFRNSYR